MFGFSSLGRDTEKKRKKSKYNIHQRVVARYAKGLGHKGFVHPSLYSKTWDSDKQRAIPGWKAVVAKGVKGGKGRAKARGGKRGKRRGGGTNLDSFSGMDNLLSRLLGQAKVVMRRLRPSESLAQRKVKLQEMIGKMDRAVQVLKQREDIEDLNRAEYKKHFDEIKRAQASIALMKKAWREAHRKQGKQQDAWGPGYGPSAEPQGRGARARGVGWTTESGYVSTDMPGRRKGKGKSKKKGGKKKGTKAKMKAAHERMWRRLHALMRGGKTLKQARSAYRAEKRKAGKPVKKRSGSKKRGSSKKRGKRSGRDFGGFTGGWGSGF